MTRDRIRKGSVSLIAILLIVILMALPTGYEDAAIYKGTDRVRAKVLSTDESSVINNGLIQSGEQYCKVKILGGKFKGEETKAVNMLSGSLESDKMFQEGDIARAYNYISCSLEDVSFGKARYRIIDIAEYLPIIKAANDSRIKADRDRVLFFLLALSVLVIALVIVFFFLRKKNHNLLKVKRSLAEQNQRLQEVTGNLTRMNEEIKESNHIKEEYIGLLFNICSE